MIHWAPGLKALYLGRWLWIELLFGSLLISIRGRRIYG